MLNMSKPNFFIIGAPKSGTTALAHYLSEHPQVYFSKPKELFYWADDHPRARTRYNMFALDDYLRFFETADSTKHLAIGEGSTNYLQSRTAVSHILKFNPASKFIVLLRDPVEVAYGMHGELLRHYFEDESNFEVAWALQQRRASGEQIPPKAVMEHQLQYSDVIDYASQLSRLFALVPPEQRKVFLFDDFTSDTKRVYRDSVEFLGLTDDGRTDFPRVNPARQYRSHLIGRFFQSPPAFIEPIMKRFRVWYASQSESLKEIVGKTLSREEPRFPLREEFKTELRNVFRPNVEAVEKLLHVNLAVWK